MVDEITDISNREQSTIVIRWVTQDFQVSNREQSTIVIRWVTQDFQVHEEFIGIYNVPSMDSATLVGMIKDVMI